MPLGREYRACSGFPEPGAWAGGHPPSPAPQDAFARQVSEVSEVVRGLEAVSLRERDLFL